MNLNDKKLFLFDIDGTIAVGDNLIDGSKELFNYIDSIGGKSMFITNNSTKSVKDYVEKFKNWNIEVDKSHFVTASYLTIEYLIKNYVNKKIFVVGTKSFVDEMKYAGITVTEEIEDDISVVVVGYDNEINYNKIRKMCEILQTKKVDYIATNPDLACPVEFGLVPDCGAICKMIEYAIHIKPIFVGKPNPEMINICVEKTGYTKDETIIIGDRLYTDIACGINANVDTALVFTGEAKPEDVINTDLKPTYVFDTISNLKEKYEG